MLHHGHANQDGLHCRTGHGDIGTWTVARGHAWVHGLPQSVSELISMTPDTTEGHARTPGLGYHLMPDGGHAAAGAIQI